MATKTWTGAVSGDLNVAGNWSPSGVPATTNEVHFPAGSPAITASVTALNTGTLGGPLGRVVFEPGFSGAVASSTAYMQFTCTSFEYSNSSGQGWIDLQASAISPQIHSTGSAPTGQRGLYLLGSALVTVNVLGGSVGIAVQPGETATVATAAALATSADLWIGPGASLTTAYLKNGASEIRCACTTINMYAGKHFTKEVGAVTTINAYGGTIYPESTGTVTTAYAFGGTIDFTTSGQGRTVTNLKQDPGGTIAYDPNVLTVTNRNAPTYPIRLSASKA